MLNVLHNRLNLGYLLCVLCFGSVILSFYPGLMSSDSISSLVSGREGIYSDINSPVMAFVWGALDRIVPGPALMFLLQHAIFWSGCAVFYATVKRKSFALAICLILFALLPQILSQLTAVWKDIGMGASLFLAAALVYRAKVTKSKIALLVSSVFLFYGYAMRVNSLPAVLPLAVWSGFVAAEIFEIGKTRPFALVIGCGYFLILSVAVYLSIYSLTSWRTVYPFHQNYLYDLAAISVAKNEALLPPYILESRQFSLDGVKARYNDFSINWLIFPDLPNKGDAPILRFAESAEEVAELRQKWFETVMANPSLYLQHRWNVFARFIGLRRSVSVSHWESGIAETPLEYRVGENIGNRILTRYFGAFNRPLPQTFFRAIVWLVLCGFFAFHAAKRKLRGDWDVVFVLAASCLLYTCSFFPTTPSTEYRYLFWSAISSAVATIFGIYLLYTELKARKIKNARAS